MPLLTPLIVVFSSEQITLKCKLQKCYVWHLQFLHKHLSNFFNCNEDLNIHRCPCNPGICVCTVYCLPSTATGNSQTPASTELNSCLACLALFIASWPRKLKGCLGESVCCDKSMLVTTKMFVTTNTCLSQQKAHNFVTSKVLSQQAHFYHDKRHVLSWKTCVSKPTCVCHDKNDTCGSSRQWQLVWCLKMV